MIKKLFLLFSCLICGSLQSRMMSLPITDRYIQWPTNDISIYSIQPEDIPGGVEKENYSTRLTLKTYLSMIGTMDAQYQRAIAASCFGNSQTLILTNTAGSVNDWIEYSPIMATNKWSDYQKGFYLGMHGPNWITNNIVNVTNSYLFVTNWILDNYSGRWSSRIPSYLPFQLNKIWASGIVADTDTNPLVPRFSTSNYDSATWYDYPGTPRFWGDTSNFVFCLPYDWSANLDNTYILDNIGKANQCPGRCFKDFFYACSTSHFKDDENIFAAKDTNWQNNPYDLFGGSKELIIYDEYYGRWFTNIVFKEIMPIFTFFGDMTHFCGKINRETCVSTYQMYDYDPVVRFFNSDSVDDVWMSYDLKNDFIDAVNDIKWTNIIEKVETNIIITATTNIIITPIGPQTNIIYTTNYSTRIYSDYPLSHTFTNEADQAYGWNIPDILPAQLGSRVWLQPWVYENIFLSCLDTFIIGPKAFPQPCFSNYYDSATKTLDWQINNTLPVLWVYTNGYWTISSNSFTSSSFVLVNEGVQTNDYQFAGYSKLYKDAIKVDIPGMTFAINQSWTNYYSLDLVQSDTFPEASLRNAPISHRLELIRVYIDYDLNKIIYTFKDVNDQQTYTCINNFFANPIWTQGVNGYTYAGWYISRQGAHLKTIDYKSKENWSWPMMYPGKPLEDDGYQYTEFSTFSSILSNPQNDPRIPYLPFENSCTQQIFRLRGYDNKSAGYSADDITTFFVNDIWQDEIFTCTTSQQANAGWTATSNSRSADVLDFVYDKNKAVDCFINIEKYLQSTNTFITGNLTIFCQNTFIEKLDNAEWVYVDSPLYNTVTYTNFVPMIETLVSHISFSDSNTGISNGVAQAEWASIGAARFKFNKMQYDDEND